MAYFYCRNKDCEYWEDEFCEYEGTMSINENGCCEKFRYKNNETDFYEDMEEVE